MIYMGLQEAIDEACDVEFPVECEEMVESCSEITFETQNGSVKKLGDIAGVCRDMPDEFHSELDFRNHIYSLAPGDCIGRQRYDDRGSQPQSDRDTMSI
ncbi:MAG: hypothetical protein J07HQX50_01514 [Haloquadratum sp. J07HQX50]|jgi:hypothetical protein|nr:MAG: hypothetical protein J07HQX50_01514 [Haloquadratum sp. J07HQX50]